CDNRIVILEADRKRTRPFVTVSSGWPNRWTVRTLKSDPLSSRSVQMLSADDLTAAVRAEAAIELTEANDKIKHCLGQLNDSQVWWRPQPTMNCIGNLILHLCGNVRQWVVAGLGGAADVRNRASEFAERGPIPKAELSKRLETLVGEAKEVLERLTPREMLEGRCIQGFDVTGLGAL